MRQGMFGLRGVENDLGAFDPLTAGLQAAGAIIPSIAKLFDESDTDVAKQQTAQAQAVVQAEQAKVLTEIAKARAQQALIAAQTQAQQATLQLQAALGQEQTKQYVGYGIAGVAAVAGLVGLFFIGKALLGRKQP